MNNKYKQNWDETKSNFSKWWKGESIGRPIFILSAPSDPNDENTDFTPLSKWQGGQVEGLEEKHNIKKAARKPKYDKVEDLWLKVPDIFERDEKRFSDTVYLAEAFPYVRAYLGTGSFCAFLGSQPEFGEDTTWFGKINETFDDAVLKLHKDSKMWNWSIETSKYAVERANKEYWVVMCDMLEGIDAMAGLFGTEDLMVEMIQNPANIHRLQEQMLPLWKEAFDAHYNIIKDEDGANGYTALSVWGPGRTAKVQCDEACMFSDAMYQEFVVPYLKRQCQDLDYVLYHLDGEDNVKHLDTVLKIDEIKCLQWSPGSGRPDGGDPCWDNIYKKALDAGKCIHAQMDSSKVKDFVKRFGKTGVLIATSAKTKEDGLRLLDESYNF